MLSLAFGPGAILHFAAYPSGSALLMAFGPSQQESAGERTTCNQAVTASLSSSASASARTASGSAETALMSSANASSAFNFCLAFYVANETSTACGLWPHRGQISAQIETSAHPFKEQSEIGCGWRNCTYHPSGYGPEMRLYTNPPKGHCSRTKSARRIRDFTLITQPVPPFKARRIARVWPGYSQGITPERSALFSSIVASGNSSRQFRHKPTFAFLSR